MVQVARSGLNWANYATVERVHRHGHVRPNGPEHNDLALAARTNRFCTSRQDPQIESESTKNIRMPLLTPSPRTRVTLGLEKGVRRG